MEIRLIAPFPFEALPRVWGWMAEFRGQVADDFAPQTLGQFMAFMRDGWSRQKTWAIYGDDELGGLITFERLSPWLGTAHITLKRVFQGKGIAVPVCREAVAAMFEQGIGKLSFYPLSGNLAIGSLLVGLGAKREGKLEAQTLCHGRPANITVYGLTRPSFEEKQNANSTHTGNSGDRSLDPGLGSVGHTEDQHRHAKQRELVERNAELQPVGQR